MYECLRDNITPNITYDYIRHLYLKHGLPSKSGRGNCPHLFSEEQAEWLVKYIPGKSSEEIAEEVNRRFGMNVTTAQIRTWKKNHRTPSGYDTKWRPGYKSWITGRKWADYMPEESQRNSRKTCFKKGNIPPNYRPVGTIVVRPSCGYKYIKVAEKPSKWRLLQLVVWEEHHGPKPDGYRITFKDGNQLNCDPDNLMLAKDSVVGVAHMKIGMTTDPELNKVILTTAELLTEINKKEKNKGDKNGKEGR